MKDITETDLLIEALTLLVQNNIISFEEMKRAVSTSRAAIWELLSEVPASSEDNDGNENGPKNHGILN